MQAYRILREAYYQQLEDKGDPSCPSVAAWMTHRKQFKASRAQTNSVTTVTVAPQRSQSNNLSGRNTPQPLHASSGTHSQAFLQTAVMGSNSAGSRNILGPAGGGNMVQQQVVSGGNATQAHSNTLHQQQIVRNSMCNNQGLANQGLSGQTLAAALTSLSQQSTQQQSHTAISGARSTTIYQHVVSGRNTVVASGGAGGGTATTAVRPQMVVVTSGSGMQLVQGGAVQLVQSTAGGAVQLVQSGAGTVQLVQSGSGGGVQLVQSSSGGGVQLVQTGSGGGVQLVQGTGGAMQLVQQGGAGVQLVQPGRITLRPMTGQTFTNLQSLLK